MKKLVLISVYDKAGLESFARRLKKIGCQILSTGNTAKFLSGAGVEAGEVSAYTGFPEILEGRVKTLHPKIHAGILSRRTPADASELKKLGAEPIDLVVVNLYPFETEPSVENIDIGGPSLLRAAAKNHEHVTVVCDPADYDRVASALEKGEVPLSLRRELAGKVFALTERFDRRVAAFFGKALRYGENPHQKGWFVPGSETGRLWGAPLQGKEISYNNILDADASRRLIGELQDSPFACAVIKHANPCGAALSQVSLADAFEKALACDAQSAFGGIVALNREVDGKTAGAMAKIFFEIVLAPGFSNEAKTVLSKKKNLRLLVMNNTALPSETVRSAGGGLLVQEVDKGMEGPDQWRVAAKRQPSEEEKKALAFAWKVVKHVHSNAIVFATTDRTLGIGAGQMSRIDAVQIAAVKMKQNFGTSAHRPVVCASDAFFPFPDNVEAIAQAGATAVIQPGGSVKDAEVIEAANRCNLAMVFTGVRHFRH